MSGESRLPENKAHEPLTVRDIVFGCGGLLGLVPLPYTMLWKVEGVCDYLLYGAGWLYSGLDRWALVPRPGSLGPGSQIDPGPNIPC